MSGTGGLPVAAIVERILAGAAPLPLRSAAARGALPLPRAVLTRLYLHLRQDADESIRADAERSLGELTADVVAEILADPACDPAVLVHFAPGAARDERLAEKVAFHPQVDAKTLHVLASEGSGAVLELVLTNQQKLLSTPGLIDRLSVNPALRPDQRGRLLDLLDRFVQATAAAPPAEGEAPAPESVTPEQAARFLDVDVGELFAASEIVDGEEFANSPDVVVQSVYKKILTLNTAQKAILAMKGGREERQILIRDSNKIVSLSVLKNGRLTEAEVESIASLRNVSDEVLRVVGINREWSKNYVVMANLVRNPRTPPGIST
ncbi:MAG TPA: hypothetical protein VJ826_12910, partial [Candidatus Polarisedimenticolaceae bacterium]|nr:hypothetical protein [Candidatus Polarisedimenticolaceae bacterium]